VECSAVDACEAALRIDAVARETAGVVIDAMAAAA
jgi:hypothetical protein